MASNTKYHDNLTVSSSPHLVTSLDTTRTMLYVVAALCPAAIMSAVYFGIPAIVMIAVCMASSVFFEWAYEKLLNKPNTTRDGSALVTGLILALNLPANLTHLSGIEYPIFMPELREPGDRRPYHPVPVLYLLYVHMASDQIPESGY